MIQSHHEDTPKNLCYSYLWILCSDTVSDVIVSECQAGAMRRWGCVRTEDVWPQYRGLNTCCIWGWRCPRTPWWGAWRQEEGCCQGLLTSAPCPGGECYRCRPAGGSKGSKSSGATICRGSDFSKIRVLCGYIFFPKIRVKCRLEVYKMQLYEC